MNRRKLLKGIVAAPVAALPVGAVADAFEEPKRNYEDEYWEAQQEIDDLYHQQQRPNVFTTGPVLRSGDIVRVDGKDYILRELE